MPIAIVDLESEGSGSIQTKAVVAEKEIDMDYYILRNDTRKLIEETKKNNPAILNTVLTRSQAKTILKRQKSKTPNGEHRGGILVNEPEVPIEDSSVSEESASEERE